MSIHDALSRRTLQWHTVRGRRPGHELRAGDEVLAYVGEDGIEVGDRLYRRASQKGGTTVLVDVATGGRMATIRELSSGPAVISVGAGRYRLTKQGVLPIAYEVTRDLGGPQVLEMLRLGPVVRVRAGADLEDAPAAEVTLLVVLSGMRLLGALVAEPAAA